MGSELNVARRAVEQTKPDTTFQLFDLNAQARRSDEKRLGRPSEVVMLRDESESAQLLGSHFHY
jgi:hypothetical protein